MAFLDPDHELQVLREDLAWPPSLDPTGDLGTLRGLDNLEAAVIGRAATVRGEIVHRREYGVDDGGEGQNGPSFPETLALAQARLLEQFTRESRIESVNVTVEPDLDVDGDVIATLRATATTGQPIGIAIPMGA